MTKKYDIRYTPPAKQSLEDLTDSFLSYLKMDGDAAEAKVRGLIKAIRQKLAPNPYLYRACDEAIDFGLDKYRQLLFDGYRILYEVQEGDAPFVAIHLVIKQRQSVRAQLIRYCLIYG